MKAAVALALVDILLWLTLCPILIPLFVVFLVYKILVHLAMAVLRPELTFIKTNDLLTARATLDKKPIVDIGFVVKIAGPVSIQALREKFRKCFISGHKLSKKKDPFYPLYCTFTSFGGYLCTQRVPLDINEQIYEQTADLSNDTLAQSYFSKWCHSPYRNDSAPRWEMVLIPSNTCSYVGFRIHHGLVDGLGLIYLLDLLCDKGEEYSQGKVEPDLTLKEKLFFLLTLPRELILYWIKAKQLEFPFSQIKNADKVPAFLVSWSTVDVNLLKSIRRKLNVPFAIILYALQTGALRRHLIEVGRADEIERTLPVLHTISKPNHPRTRLLNHWTLVKLHTLFSEPDPIQRIKQTQEEYVSFTETGLPFSAPAYFVNFVRLLPTKFCLLNLRIPFSVYKAGLACTVRSSKPYFLLGQRVTNIYHTFCTKDLCPDAVLYTSTASHSNQIDITHAASPMIVQDQEAMQQLAEKHFNDELQELVAKCNYYQS